MAREPIIMCLLYLTNDAKILFQQPKKLSVGCQLVLTLIRVTNPVQTEMSDLFFIVIIPYSPENLGIRTRKIFVNIAGSSVLFYKFRAKFCQAARNFKGAVVVSRGQKSFCKRPVKTVADLSINFKKTML